MQNKRFTNSGKQNEVLKLTLLHFETELPSCFLLFLRNMVPLLFLSLAVLIISESNINFWYGAKETHATPVA